nr:probable serine incorporator [Ipomoea batatas]
MIIGLPSGFVGVGTSGSEGAPENSEQEEDDQASEKDALGGDTLVLHTSSNNDDDDSLASEARDYECNALHKHSKSVSTGTLTIGLLTTVLSVVYSSVRAGSSTALLSPPSSPRAGVGTSGSEGAPENSEQEEDDQATEKDTLGGDTLVLHTSSNNDDDESLGT